MLNQELKLVFPELYHLAKKETEAQGRVMYENGRLLGIFNWCESSQGHSFWADIWGSDFKIWKEDATLPYLKKYNPEVYEMAILEKRRQYSCTIESAKSFQGCISAYFNFERSFKGYDFWSAIAFAGRRNSLKTTIGKRLNKEVPFIVEDSNGRLLYKEDENGNWYRRKYNNQGNLILIKNSKGKLWRTTVTTG